MALRSFQPPVSRYIYLIRLFLIFPFFYHVIRSSERFYDILFFLLLCFHLCRSEKIYFCIYHGSDQKLKVKILLI